MDFPISVPGIGLVDGKFIDEDALSGTPGSLIPSVWGNSITLEILNVIEAAGLTPDEDNNAQLLQAINSILLEATPAATEVVLGLIRRATQVEVDGGSEDTSAVTAKKLAVALRNQALTALTTGGTATTLTLTPAPAIQAYAASQRFSVKFSVTGGTNPTLNVSAKGPKSLKQYDASGSKVSAAFVADQIADVVYDGTDWIMLDPLPAAAGNLIGIQGAAKNLVGSASGLSAAVAYTADEIIVESAENTYQVLRSVTITPTFATAGANGLDAGVANSQAASTWYSVWVIWNGATIAGLLSLSATAPTMPAGYTHKARVGWVRTDATANKFPLSFSQFGRQVRYVVRVGSNVLAAPAMAGGVLGNVSTPTWAAVSVSPFIPPTASIVDFFVFSQATGCYYMVADTDAYGSFTSTTNPPPIALTASTSAAAVDFLRSISRLMLTSGRNIYCAANVADFSMRCLGWEDAL